MYGQNVRRTLATGFQCGTSGLISSTNHIFAKNKTAGSEIPTNVLDSGEKIGAINRK